MTLLPSFKITKEGTISVSPIWNFYRALKAAGKAACADEGIPVLENICLLAKDSLLKIIATDSIQLVIVEMPYDGPECAFVLPFAFWKQLLRSLKAHSLQKMAALLTIAVTEKSINAHHGSICLAQSEAANPTFPNVFSLFEDLPDSDGTPVILNPRYLGAGAKIADQWRRGEDGWNQVVLTSHGLSPIELRSVTAFDEKNTLSYWLMPIRSSNPKGKTPNE